MGTRRNGPSSSKNEVYCTTGASDVVITHINVTALDPQGVSDLKEGEWTAYDIDTGEEIFTDALYCDGQECIYSYHAEQIPELPCSQLTILLWATVWDWSGTKPNHWSSPFLVSSKITAENTDRKGRNR